MTPALSLTGVRLLAAASARHGTWASYAGAARIWLGAGLFVGAAVVVWLGIRRPATIRPAHPVREASVKLVALLAAWGIAIVAFLVCVSVYLGQLRQVHVAHPAPADPITPVTYAAVVATFLIVWLTGPVKSSTTVLSAAIAALSGPMVFELPFDLIVMSRTYPSIPPDPALWRAVFFAPLILIEILTLALLWQSPIAKLTRTTFLCFGLMLAVFGGWALTGFGYPLTAVPIAFNVAGKLLAFGTVISMFVPRDKAVAATEVPLTGQSVAR